MRSFKLFLQFTSASILFTNLSLLEAQPQPSETAASVQALNLREFGVSIPYPSGWSPHGPANFHELLNVTPEKLAKLQPGEWENFPRIATTVIRCADHAEAVHRLREIAAERDQNPEFLTIGGWPALQRRMSIDKPLSSRSSGLDKQPEGERLIMVTTAVAAENTLIRLDGYAPESAGARAADQMETIGRGIRVRAPNNPESSRDEVQELRNSPRLQTPLAPPPEASPLRTPAMTYAPLAIPPKDVIGPSIPAAFSPAIDLGVANLLIGSESEIAVSTNGQNIVVAQGCRYRNSTDSGTTFPNNGGSPGNCSGGDSSVAFGRSGNFYWANIGSNNATCPPPVPPAVVNNCNNTQQLNRSLAPNNGQAFTFVTNVIDCRAAGAACGFGSVPDQEHIAADRFNFSNAFNNALPANQDLVYEVFRRGGTQYAISCSSDSGANWTAPVTHPGDFPRITVGQNGTVYVVTINGNNVNLDSYGPCSSGLVQNLNQVAIAMGINQVSCPVSGLDRCNNGNVLSSPTVAVDDTNANHLYAAYAVNTVAGNPGNENVLVQDSTNGGANWRAAVQVNQSINGRRFEPWVCAMGGSAFVSWYDRRASTAAANDLTDYFSGSASLDGAGNLVPGVDFQINAPGTADPQCASGWPCQTRSPADAESCSNPNVQQLAGLCGHSPAQPTDTNTPCDFSGPDATVCPSSGTPATPESCQPVANGGCPKYGDYTANACQFARLYNVWASATAQPGTTPSVGITSFFTSQLEHNPPLAKCQNVTVFTGPGATTCTVPASINNGSSDPDGDTITLTQSPAGPYPLGNTLVTLTVTDQFGATATCTGTVTVVDNTPPVAVCPPQYTESADNTCHAPIPNVIPDVVVTDNCPGPFTESQAPVAGTPETLGVTPIHVSVKDASGNPAACDTSLKVVDTTPPVVTSSVASPLIWPPNHDLQNVGLAASATDNCDPHPVIAVKGIFSTEPDLGPDADSNFSPDAKDIGVGTLRLRAERPGGDNRIYLDALKATDASGNVGYSCNTVVVPMSMNPAAIAAVNAAAAIQQAFCASHSGTPPAGDFPVGIGPIAGPKQ